MDLFINNIGSYDSVQLLPTVTQEIGNENMELMKVKNFESCRLCLVEIQDSNVTLLDGIIKDMLEIILPELNLSICETPAICKTCLETLKQSYNFKSSCLEVEDKVQDFVNPKSPASIDLKQVLKKKNNINQISDNHVVCRTCLGLGEENSCTKLGSYDGDPLKNMVEKCLPEMGIDLTKDPIICQVCLEQLEEQFHFIMQCLDTEEKINYYCERKTIFKQIDLHSVYLFSMIDHEDVEKQYGVVENGNLERECTSVTIEDNLNRSDMIKQSILQDNVKNVSDSDEFVDLTKDPFGCNIKKDKTKNDNFAQKEPSLKLENMNVQLFGQRPVRKIEPPAATEEVTFQISKDGNGEDIITSQTSRIHKDNDEDSDVSVTSESALLTTRFVEKVPNVGNKRRPGMEGKKTSGIRKEKVEYKDDKDEDSGEASEASYPKKRLVTRKCKLCNFKTKYNSRMKAHKTVYHSAKSEEPGQDGGALKKVAKPKPETDPNPKNKCRTCTYTTRDSEEFKKHKLDHKKEKEQKCPLCELTFVRPDFLKKHIDSHGSRPTSLAVNKTPQKNFSRLRSPAKPSQKHSFNFNGQFLKMFKCQICPYQTRMRSNLVRHSLTHKTTSEIKSHKCKLCKFETIHKENFLSHMQNHSHDSENQVKKCFLCSYEPKTEKALKQHVNMAHKSGTG